MTTRPQRSSRGAHTLPAEYYLSQEVFERETTRIFDSAWHLAGLTTNLAEPGDYFVADVERENLIVLRDRDGRIRAFHNVCRHRGTRLCKESGGKIRKNLVCPYHSWTYDLTGALVSAPNMSDVEGFDASELPLQSVACEVWNGLVFVSFAPEPQPLAEALPGLAASLSDWPLEQLVPVHRTEYEVDVNWKLVFQNYSECYHCPTLHPVLNRLTPYRDSDNDLEAGPVLGGPMYLAEGSKSMTMDGSACAPLLPGAETSSEGRLTVHYYVVFPTCFLSLMPDYALVHRIQRRGPLASTITCDWLFDREAAAAPGFDPSGAIDFWDMTNRQDWEVCTLSQQGIGSRAYEPGPYSNLESMIAAFDREYLRALGDA